METANRIKSHNASIAPPIRQANTRSATSTEANTFSAAGATSMSPEESKTPKNAPIMRPAKTNMNPMNTNIRINPRRPANLLRTSLKDFRMEAERPI